METESLDVRALLRAVDSSSSRERLLEAGITEQALIELARRIASDTHELGQAWRELQNAIEIAIEIQRSSDGKSAGTELIEDVIASAAEKGSFQEAWKTIADARIEQRNNFRNNDIALLEAAEKHARLAKDPQRAAEAIIASTDLRNEGPATSPKLLETLANLLERSSEEKLEGLIGIEVAREAVDRAANSAERAEALNALGIAMHEIGRREDGVALLEDSISAFQSALKENSFADSPSAWGRTQNNLGNALQTLGERESGTSRLTEAISAYRNALAEQTRERVPLNWAATQNNLGNALSTLGGREGSIYSLEEAVDAYRNALQEWTRDRVPLNWAMTKNSLGNTLQALGALENGKTRLEEAFTSYQDALKEWTRDRVPLDWASTQCNLTMLELTLFDKTGNSEHLRAARDYLANAKEVVHESGATHFISLIEALALSIDARAEP